MKLLARWQFAACLMSRRIVWGFSQYAVVHFEYLYNFKCSNYSALASIFVYGETEFGHFDVAFDVAES